ncbi:MAG: hypothetical protein QNM02_00490 [Acidimicrobiia bacterium]|nr:hypothetical protein [Acidimicrobiia bacterium]
MFKGIGLRRRDADAERHRIRCGVVNVGDVLAGGLLEHQRADDWSRCRDTAQELDGAGIELDAPHDLARVNRDTAHHVLDGTVDSDVVEHGRSMRATGWVRRLPVGQPIIGASPRERNPLLIGLLRVAGIPYRASPNPESQRHQPPGR